jgi:Tol biopolymer transport system component
MAFTWDGGEIVFSSNRGGTQGLWRMAVSGSGEPQLLAAGENGHSPAISQQGNRLVCSQAISDNNIWRVNLSEPREPPAPFISSTRNEREARYSPDGRKIAFSSDRSGSTEVGVCDADGSNPVQLVSLGRSSSPSWSPDSQRIAFDSNVEGRWQLYTISSHGGRPQRISRSAASETRPTWSRDGKWIYFGSDRTLGSQPAQIWKVPAGGGEALQISTKGGYNPVDSDDGKTIYYTTTNGVSTPLWKLPREGGEPVQLLPSVQLWNFAVARGGIYFVAEQELRYFSFATGTSKPILKIPKPVSLGLSVSPDEHWLLYAQLDQSGSDLMLVENFR